MMIPTIEVKGKITERTFEDKVLPQFVRALGELKRGSTVRTIRTVRIDLSGLQYSGPSLLLSLIVMSGYINENLRAKIWVDLPKSEPVLRYLYRMKFFDYLEPNADFDRVVLKFINKYKESKASKRVLEISKILEAGDTNRIVNSLLKNGYNIIKSNLGFCDIEINRFLGILAELCLNICDHCESWGIVTIQTLSYNSKEMVKICVADGGIGIRNSLLKKHSGIFEPTQLDDCDALKSVLGPGLTRKVGRELGLFGIKNIVSNWMGEIRMRSLKGRMTMLNSQKELTVPNLCFFPGTQVDIYLPCGKAEKSE